MEKQGYPQVGGIQNGTAIYKGYGDPAYRRVMARLDFVILGGGLRQLTYHANAIKGLYPSLILGKQSIQT
jgi:hypothetical protein